MRAHGAVPATVAVLDGRARSGCAVELDRVAGRAGQALGRDLAWRSAGPRRGDDRGRHRRAGRAAGVPLFATGGLGGVHRGAREPGTSPPTSPRSPAPPVLVVCSGVKSILDVAATLEVLETASVPVLGYGTDAFPGFYRRDSGLPVPWRVDGCAEVAAAWRAHRALGGGSGLVLAQPVPAADELDAALHDRLLAEGSTRWRRAG